MKKMMHERGSISIFVIIGFIFCMTLLLNIYWSNVNYQVTVLQAEQVIQDIYKRDVDNMEEIHAQLIT